MSTIPAAVLAEAREAAEANWKLGDFWEDTVAAYEAVIARHWPAAASDRYAAVLAEAQALRDALRDILEYRGGADSALDDSYVMERARAALDAEPAATPDRYAAGFRAGLEKAARHTVETFDDHTVAKAIRALAPPDDGLLRWLRDGEPGILVAWRPIAEYVPPDRMAQTPLVLVGRVKTSASGRGRAVYPLGIAFLDVHRRWIDCADHRPWDLPPTHFACNCNDIPVIGGLDDE